MKMMRLRPHVLIGYEQSPDWPILVVACRNDNGSRTKSREIGQMLLTYYNSFSKAETLISYGAIQELGENLLLTEFYHRDIGTPIKISEFQMIELKLQKDTYIFLFRDNEWVFIYNDKLNTLAYAISLWRQD